MTILYQDRVGGMIKSGLHCETWREAREKAAAVLMQFPSHVFGTVHRFKTVADGVEVHLQRFEHA
ncbi:hypothetical protein ACXHXM_34240